MRSLRSVSIPLALGALGLSVSVCASGQAQQSAVSNVPRDYAGVQVRIPGVFVTPVPGAPFAAKVDIFSTQLLANGETEVRTTVNRIARDSSGRIHNERRRLVPPGHVGDPVLSETHLYDPATRLNVWMNPFTHVAREMVSRAPVAIPQASAATGGVKMGSGQGTSGVTQEDLGTKSLNGLELKGSRKSRTVTKELSGTGKPVVVVDEYWYSPELSIYVIVRHEDPRTGEQRVVVSEVDRREPNPDLFAVPSNFKIADETPVE
ncbi:hypothetical protein [Granulicella aggregans]|uniref:hypothetical protein n=1 Tax=Granulicella aggregans TaxID=474949 RepID=UPI0021E01D6F|nr:hypothetical protein [Granulicella aggregans]